MQRILNVNKWFPVPDGKAVNFGATEPRRVRLDVNCPEPVKLDYVDGNGEVTFLAAVHGRDVIEFMSYGEFSIIVTGGPCNMYTIDGEDISFSIPDAVKLTKLVERRARNPELELMQHMMNRNIEMRMERMRNELERQWAERTTAAPALTEQRPTPDSGRPSGAESGSDGLSGAAEQPDAPDGSSGTTAKG